MPKSPSATSATTPPESLTLKAAHHQDAVDALAFAETTLNQLTALLSSIQQADDLQQAQRLAGMGRNYSDDMANYFDCAREDLAKAVQS